MTIYNIIALGYLTYSMPSVFNTFVNLIKRNQSVLDILECSRCVSFWVVLIATQSLVYAALVSLVVFLLDSFITTKL